MSHAVHSNDSRIHSRERSTKSSERVPQESPNVQPLEETAMKGSVRDLAIGLALAAMLPPAVSANDTCNGFINIDYVGAPPVTNIGDIVRVRVSLGTGSIQGGTKLTVDSMRFFLDCNANFPLTPPCTDEGGLVQFEGNVTTTCPGISSAHPISPDPNEVIFTAVPPLDIPANVPTLPGFCAFEFDVRVLAPSIDGSGKIEELIGYDIAACDNGVLVSGGFQTAAIETPPPLHFDCYQVTTNGNIPDVLGISLVDRFGATTAKATEMKRVCAPANKNNEDPAAPGSPVHLTGYEITPSPFTRRNNVQVATQFGVLTLDVVRPFFLFNTASKNPNGMPLPPPLGPTDVPHWNCYKTDDVTGDKERNDIVVQDQFLVPGSITLDLDKRGPFRLCVPVNKNGGDPSAPTNPAALMCYSTKNDALPFGEKFPGVTDQFTSRVVKITQYDELCVPATILN